MRWILLVVAVAGCHLDYAAECVNLPAGSHAACTMPGWVDRAFELDVPPQWDGRSPLPVILVFHGGGGNRDGTNRTTCANGDVGDPSCLVAQALARGYAVVAPDGTGSRPLRNIRTWNAGGGHQLQCVSGGGCKSHVDDLRYATELLDRIGAAIPVDARRVFATGISNGGAMSHRLACQLPDRIAAIAPVSGANEWADDGDACDARVPIRQFHGTEDPCWPFDGGAAACLQDDGKAKTSVMATFAGWATRNGCSQTFADTPRAERDLADGTTLAIRAWQGCAATTELFVITGGGHTWPGGWQYFSDDTVGRVSHEADNADILDFFDAHPHP